VSVGTEKFIKILEEYASVLLSDTDCELVEVQFRHEGHGWVLRFYIDSERGVTLDDCASFSREMSAYLEVEDLIDHTYHLEVSSPGLERPLKEKKDFVRFAGRQARIKIREPREEQRVFVGILEGLEGETVILQVDGVPVRLELEQITKARLTL
jgi:ribosome maturation factor RimP